MPPEVIALLAHMSVARAVSLALWLVGSGSAVVLLAANTRRSLDPRPAVRHAAESGCLKPVWQVAVHAGHDFNRAVHASHEALRDAAALLLLLTTSPKGVAR